MVPLRDFPIVGDSFNVGYRFQRYWDTPMANAFFFGELGAGAISRVACCSASRGMLAGLLITGMLKTYFHLSHMGVPPKSWRAIIRPDRSWISRGLLGIVFMMTFGVAHLLITWLDLQSAWALSPALTGLVKLVAGAAALVVMTYQGFAMSHSTAIALWSTGLMPVSSLVYAATSGVMVTLAAGAGGSSRQLLAQLGLVLLLVAAVVLLSLLHGAHHGSPGGRKSVELLTRTLYAKWFYGLVWAVGLVLPAALLVIATDSAAVLMLAAASMLAGYYTFRVLIFKAGVFEPIMSFRP